MINLMYLLSMKIVSLKQCRTQSELGAIAVQLMFLLFIVLALNQLIVLGVDVLEPVRFRSPSNYICFFTHLSFFHISACIVRAFAI